MTTVAVLPETSVETGTTYHAVAGSKQSTGRTIGEAIDALTPQLEDSDNSATLIIVQQQRPDKYFTSEQMLRRDQLMAMWRKARDANKELPGEEQAELDALVMAEVRAAGLRAAAMLQQAPK
jgi:hypothetical protein